ncbi:DUF4307 domain-containing protein [Streptomyces sp. VRA16 Mangrove soil]|uniref:DUF4307 domain-containing protein n=1 Tax=Streptomyces sp. VRA16 Mangrove soil TaxID=2817434 RepID=UPI001A9FD409|nr:DUF4307 domain-containing protein [Streptomyces sp. VRA16 Mangrove soil]MBO1334712.1 DUF4307 domain-containing protein [Streptomyces sp. VRA16 Mangrove soil]
MSAVQQHLPEGRYGSARSADARADRKLKIAGIVLGVLFAALIGWFGWYYVGGNTFSGEVIAFKTYDDNVKVHLEIRKDTDATGYCTIRSQDADGAEVGRADFHFDQKRSRVDKVVTLRTAGGRGTTAELVGCHAD